MARGLLGERIEKKICYIIFVMKYFSKFLLILLGIVVSALAFHAGGLGSIPRLGKSSNQLFLLLLLLLLLQSPNLPH
jgi:hypothetical protein